MRENQVTIKLERFGNKDKLGIDDLEINVYADSNNVYEALSAGYYEVLKQLQYEGKIDLPTFGRREHYPTNSYRYKRIFHDFLAENDIYVDKWKDFKKVTPTFENQFLEKMDLKKEYEEYFERELEGRAFHTFLD